MSAIYNEIEPFAAQWMRSLIAAQRIAPGVVNEASITDLSHADVAGPGQRHFFAGIGGWSYALRLAGVPDDADIWTGSCPCQPFSSAARGRAGGFDSAKHLWPAWRLLIEHRRPSIVFGEQVGTGDGPRWLDLVFDDFECLGYAVGAADLCSSIHGYPARRRLFFVAYADGDRKRNQRINAPLASIREAARLACEDQRELHGLDSESDGLPGAMGRRRGYGNAINPIVAAAFIEAALG